MVAYHLNLDYSEVEDFVLDLERVSINTVNIVNVAKNINSRVRNVRIFCCVSAKSGIVQLYHVTFNEIIMMSTLYRPARLIGYLWC